MTPVLLVRTHFLCIEVVSKQALPTTTEASSRHTAAGEKFVKVGHTAAQVVRLTFHLAQLAEFSRPIG